MRASGRTSPSIGCASHSRTAHRVNAHPLIGVRGVLLTHYNPAQPAFIVVRTLEGSLSQLKIKNPYNESHIDSGRAVRLQNALAAWY